MSAVLKNVQTKLISGQLFFSESTGLSFYGYVQLLIVPRLLEFHPRLIKSECGSERQDSTTVCSGCERVF